MSYRTAYLYWQRSVFTVHYTCVLSTMMKTQMERFIVSVGQNVTKGQVLGYEGSTGASTGPHVHFMVLVNNIWVNPVLYVQLP